jgi:hypothetical protein
MSHAPHRRIIWSAGVAVICVLFLLFIWLFVGHLRTFEDEEPRDYLFWKKYPTFKIQFTNPDNSEEDYRPFSELSARKQKAIIAYCKYRHGVVSTEISEIEACRQKTNARSK